MFGVSMTKNGCGQSGEFDCKIVYLKNEQVDI